jgi:hypothetical protein
MCTSSARRTSRVATNRALEEVADERAVRRSDSRPAALRDLEQPAGLEAACRLANGQAADPQRLRELAFRRQRVPGLEAVEDQPFELFDHGIEHGAAADRLQLFQRYGFVSHAEGKNPVLGPSIVLTATNISDRLAA